MFLFVCLGVLVGKIHRLEDGFDSWWRQVRGSFVIFCFLLRSVCAVPANVTIFIFYRMEDQFAALHENPDMWVFLFQNLPHKVLSPPSVLQFIFEILFSAPLQNYWYPGSSHARHPGHESEAARRRICCVWWGRQVRSWIGLILLWLLQEAVLINVMQTFDFDLSEVI